MSEEERVEGFVHQENQSQKSALGLTVRKGADSWKRDVDIVMPVKYAENHIEKRYSVDMKKTQVYLSSTYRKEILL
jgi:hypothetical protein